MKNPGHPYARRPVFTPGHIVPLPASDRYLVTLLVMEEKGRKQSFVGLRNETQPIRLAVFTK